MSALMLQAAQHGAALIGLIGLIALAFAAATTRSLFALAMLLAAFGALAGVTALALGAPQVALALPFVCAALGPICLLGLMLLSTRVAKPRGRGRAWATAGAIGLTAAVLLGGGYDIVGAARPALAPNESSVLWLAALILAAGIGAFGLLAFGERGALGADERGGGAP